MKFRVLTATFAVAVTTIVPSSLAEAARVSSVPVGQSQWNAMVNPNPNASFGPVGLTGISCVSQTFCLAVGHFPDQSGNSTSQALIEVWDGAQWTTVPGFAGPALLLGVSCTSPQFCMAVGWAAGSSTATTLTAAWDGISWTVLPSPSNGPFDNHLYDVSCSSPAQCIAVGDAGNLALALVWDGSVWRDANARLPTGADGWLAGVSCTTSSCIAVGASHTTRNKTLVERWNGSAWSIVSSPSPGTSDYWLNDVSCADAMHCTAVGGLNFNQAIAMSWTAGGQWVMTNPANPGLLNNGLGGVSCVAPASCVAAGSSQTGSSSETLVQAWDGSQWTVITSPNISAPQGNSLGAVSCVVAVGCAAVGEYLPTGQPRSLVVSDFAGPNARPVGASWTNQESVRLQEMAAFLAQTPEETQKTAVYLLAYLIGFLPATPLPQSLPTPGQSAHFVSTWSPDEFGVLASVNTKFVLTDSDTTRFSVNLLSFILGLQGH